MSDRVKTAGNVAKTFLATIPAALIHKFAKFYTDAVHQIDSVNLNSVLLLRVFVVQTVNHAVRKGMFVEKQERVPPLPMKIDLKNLGANFEIFSFDFCHYYTIQFLK